jgi:hypothetical protein
MRVFYRINSRDDLRWRLENPFESPDGFADG